MDITARSVTFGTVPLRSLRRSHVEGWVKSMSARGLAASTITTRVNNVRSVLRGAVADRVIPVDPSIGVALPRRRRREAAMTLPSAADVKRLLDSADIALRAFVGLCAFAGLRPSEAAGVQVGDIDFLRGTLSVSRQVQRSAGGFEIRAPKYGSERKVFLAPSLVSMLSEHLADSIPEGEQPRPTRWLFTGQADGPPPPNTVDHRWRTLRKSAGVGDGIRLHDMRHFYASGLIAAGCDVVTVQRALGHASATTTLNTYSHLWPTAEDRTRNAAEGLLQQTAAELPADSVRTSAQD
jgi:integrase